MRQHGQGAFEGNEIPGICRLIADLTDQTLQVINRVQVFTDLFPGDRVPVQFFDGIQTPVDLILFNQRLLDKAPEHSGPHCGLRLIQHPHQGTSLLFFPQRLAQLQISSGRTVDDHIFSRHIGYEPCQIGQRILLRLCQVLQKRSCRDHAAVIVRQPQSLQRLHLKMFHQRPSAQVIVKIPVLQRINGNSHPRLHILQIDAAHIKGFIADDLCRRKFRDLIHQLSVAVKLRHKIIPGRNI